MGKIINTIMGNLEEKREYKENEARAKALPAEYAAAYSDIKDYIFHTSGLLTMAPLKALVDLLEEAAADGKHVLDVTGPDVATFADELVHGEKSYFDQQRQKLNIKMANQDKKNR